MTRIRNNPAIDALNHINFTRNRVEGCGNSSSNAGGIDLTFNDIGPRGFQFTDCQAEGNFGSDECYFSKVTGLYLNGFYVETLDYNVGGIGDTPRAGIEATDCTGHVHGAQMYADIGTPKQALKFNGSSRFTVMDLDTGAHWATSTIETNDSATVRYANVTANGGTVNLNNNGSGSITLM